MLSRRFGWTVIVMTVALAGASLLVAGPHERRGPHRAGHGGHGGPGGPGPGMVEHMTEALDLSETQAGQVKEIVTRYHEGELREIMSGLREGKKQLGTLIHDASAGEQQVIDAANQVAGQELAGALARHRMVLEIDALLTAEQREKARGLMQQRLEETGDFGPGKRRGRGRGHLGHDG